MIHIFRAKGWRDGVLESEVNGPSLPAVTVKRTTTITQVHRSQLRAPAERPRRRRHPSSPSHRYPSLLPYLAAGCSSCLAAPGFPAPGPQLLPSLPSSVAETASAGSDVISSRRRAVTWRPAAAPRPSVMWQPRDQWRKPGSGRLRIREGLGVKVEGPLRRRRVGAGVQTPRTTAGPARAPWRGPGDRWVGAVCTPPPSRPPSPPPPGAGPRWPRRGAGEILRRGVGSGWGSLALEDWGFSWNRGCSSDSASPLRWKQFYTLLWRFRSDDVQLLGPHLILPGFRE